MIQFETTTDIAHPDVTPPSVQGPAEPTPKATEPAAVAPIPSDALQAVDPPKAIPQADGADSDPEAEEGDEVTIKKRSGEEVKFRARHRSVKSIATPQDVPRIRELTGKVKDRDARIAQLEADLAARTQTVSAPPKPPAANDKPGWKAYEDQIGSTYQTWADAQEAWADARDAWKDRQLQQAKQQEQAQRSDEDQRAGYQQREAAFRQAHPDYDEAVSELMQHARITPVLQALLLRDDKSAEFVYHLGRHPQDFEEVNFRTMGLPASDDAVATTRRWLLARVQAGTTGAAAPPSPVIPGPRPPTPVRTGPITTGAERPGDDAGFDAHKAFYHSKRR